MPTFPTPRGVGVKNNKEQQMNWSIWINFIEGSSWQLYLAKKSIHVSSYLPGGHNIRTNGERKEDMMPALVKQRKTMTFIVCKHTNQIFKHLWVLIQPRYIPGIPSSVGAGISNDLCIIVWRIEENHLRIVTQYSSLNKSSGPNITVMTQVLVQTGLSNRVDPDQTPRSAASSDHGLHCFAIHLTYFKHINR